MRVTMPMDYGYPPPLASRVYRVHQRAAAASVHGL